MLAALTLPMSERDDEQRPEAAGGSFRARGKKKVDAVESAPARAPAPEPTTNDAPEAPARRHRIRGALLFALGATATFVLMSNEEPVPRGVLIGLAGVLLATIGLLDLTGLLAASAHARKELAAAIDWRETSLAALPGEPAALAPIVTVPLAVALFLAIALAGGVERLPVAILAGLACLAPSAIRRPMLLVFTIASAIVLPCLGIYGLWDPWETHYGEVAREILARDDWISLWWAQEDWFWSKPILIFWLEALSMSALGVDFRPDAHPAHPEWAIRLPHYLLTIGALLSVYALVQRGFGRRAGVIAALVLCTMPYFFLLSHQAITDMPFVSTMTMAMCMLGLAILERPEREVRRYRFGPVLLSAQHALLGALSLVAIPQMILLATRNVTLVTGGFAWHRDRFWFGSAGNAGNPGNAEMREVTPVFDDIVAQPMAQSILWLAGFLFLVWRLRRERRAQSLFMCAFYFFCALSFMAKGIAGFMLPGLVALLWLVATRRWDLLLEGRLRVASGIVVLMTIGLPWYVAMYIRHGQGFTDRLLVHDHINRLTAGVHGDTGSIEYFLEQLGVGLFPWIGLAPIAIGSWIVLTCRRAGAAATEAARQALPVRTAGAPAAERRGGASASAAGAGGSGTVRDAEPGRDPSAAPPASHGADVEGPEPAAGDHDSSEQKPAGAPQSSGDLRTAGAPQSSGDLRTAGAPQTSCAPPPAGAPLPADDSAPAPSGAPEWSAPASKTFGLGAPEVGASIAASVAAPSPSARDPRSPEAQREILALVGLWGTAAFVLFSAMTTKFHHYIFPAVPACGMLVGIALDRLFGPRSDLTRVSLRGLGATLLAGLAPVPIAVGIAGFWGDVRGVVPEGVSENRMREWALAHPWPPVHCVLLIALGIALAAAAFRLLRTACDPGESGREPGALRRASAAATSGLFAAPAILGLVGRDLSWVTSARPHGYERLIHLFVYNYGRPWPPHFDYRPILTGFAITAGLVIGLAALPIVRQVALRAFFGLAVAFAVWCLDVYMIDLSPHWSQRELLDRYYEERGGPHEPLIAWQMNWKGENFYSGNRVYAFVDLDNRRLQEWVRQHPGQRVWFLLEHSRLASLRGVLRGAQVQPITDERLDNKFVLVRVDLPPREGPHATQPTH
jgi:4-amino-4-deoxy-L-arabinose transferase-like glycosyltransferase